MKQDFGLPHLIRFPILPELSEAGDGKASSVTKWLSPAVLFPQDSTSDKAEIACMHPVLWQYQPREPAQP